MTDGELVEAVARRVVELLREEGYVSPRGGPALLTTRQVAEKLGHSTDWVRQHRHELGVRPGTGTRPRLLFDALAVTRYVTLGPVDNDPERRTTVLRRANQPRVDLLPIDGPIVPRPGER